jgi:hypothetical protein
MQLSGRLPASRSGLITSDFSGLVRGHEGTSEIDHAGESKRHRTIDKKSSKSAPRGMFFDCDVTAWDRGKGELHAGVKFTIFCCYS